MLRTCKCSLEYVGTYVTPSLNMTPSGEKILCEEAYLTLDGYQQCHIEYPVQSHRNLLVCQPPRDWSRWLSWSPYTTKKLLSTTGPLRCVSVTSNAIISATIRLRLTSYPSTVFKYVGQLYPTSALLLLTILPDKRCVVLIMKVI